MQMRDKALKWAMRIGYGARGIVYLIVGILAVFAAINGGEAEGSTGALAYLARQPFGKVLLSVIAAGLFTYTGWRAVDAVLDLEDEGHDAMGIGNRLGQFMSGAAHAILGFSAVSIVISAGGAGSGGGSGAEQSTDMILDYPGGRWLIVIAGIVTGCVGGYLMVKACHSKWKSELRNTTTTEVLMPIVRFGLFAHGIVVLIIAGLFIWAGFTLDADKAGGLEQALNMLERQPFGRVILFVTGAGFVGFSFYCFVCAGYRLLPGVGEDREQETLQQATAPADVTPADAAPAYSDEDEKPAGPREAGSRP